MNTIQQGSCSNGCHRMHNAPFSTCCKACGTGSHTADCNTRNGICANNCGRKCGNYEHCCPGCVTGNHTVKCDQRNPIKPAQKAYIIIGQMWGKNSVKVTINGCNYGNPRKPHVNFGSNPVPQQGTKYFLGNAKIGGIGNKAIMRDLLDPQTNKPTNYHITVYYETAGQGTAASLLSYYSQ